jgi:hypothetical protein
MMPGHGFIGCCGILRCRCQACQKCRDKADGVNQWVDSECRKELTIVKAPARVATVLELERKVGIMAAITVRRDDLERQEAFATTYTTTGVTEDGRRVRFAGDWRTMQLLFDKVMVEGEVTTEVDDGQIVSEEAAA